MERSLAVIQITIQISFQSREILQIVIYFLRKHKQLNESLCVHNSGNMVTLHRERKGFYSLAFSSIVSYLADLETCQHPPCEISSAAHGVDKCASPSKSCLTYPSL